MNLDPFTENGKLKEKLLNPWSPNGDHTRSLALLSQNPVILHKPILLLAKNVFLLSSFSFYFFIEFARTAARGMRHMPGCTAKIGFAGHFYFARINSFFFVYVHTGFHPCTFFMVKTQVRNNLIYPKGGAIRRLGKHLPLVCIDKDLRTQVYA